MICGSSNWTWRLIRGNFSNLLDSSWYIGYNIKKAFETNEFPATKNTLCDWCYYKPICPVFNENAPDTEKLKEINEELIDIKEQIEALDMFENIDELPDKSELASLNINELEEKYQKLDIERAEMEDSIQKLLRE